MANDYTQLVTNLLESVDVIAQSKVEELEYNKTIKCHITNADNASKGEYTVTDGSSTFLAYSDNTKYKVNNYVYVLIPNGDYSQQKTIIGKYVSSSSEYYTYTTPSDSFVDITENIIDTTDITFPVTLIANGDTKEVEVWSSDPNLNLTMYDRLLIKCDFKSWLSSYHVSAGTYGVKLVITLYHKISTQNNGEYIFKEYELNTNDMYGDPYNFETYYTQEKLFSVDTITDESTYITKVQLFFFQKGDFVKSDASAISVSQTENLFMMNPVVSFGYALEDFTSDKVILGSFDGKNYATYLTAERKAELNIASNASPEELQQYIDTYNAKDIFVRWVHIVDEVSSGSTTTSVGTSGVKSIQNAANLPSGAVLHWYRYNLSEGVSDPLAGAFWEEIISAKNKFKLTNFQPDITEAFDRLKVVIEQPTTDALEAEVAEIENYNERKQYADIYEQFKDDETSLRNAINGLGLSLTNEEFAEVAEDYLSEVAEIYSQQVLYESDIIEFTNESPVVDKATWDLIKGLTLEVDEKGYKGIYRIYDEMGELYSSSESTKKRIITAKYTSLVTGDESLDTAEAITWTIPIKNTMIFYPEDGIEYDSKNDIVTTDEDNIYITRYGIVSSNTAGDEEADSTQQYFRIKKQYIQTATNNTIRCKVVKNNSTYEQVAELVFGVSGTNGTDYTLSMEFKSKEPAITISQGAQSHYDIINSTKDLITELTDKYDTDLKTIENDTTLSYDDKTEKTEELANEYDTKVKEYQDIIDAEEKTIRLDENNATVFVIPHVYDYEGRDITTRFDADDFEYEWYSSNTTEDGTAGITINEVEESDNVTQNGAIKLIASSDMEACQFHILKLTIRRAATVLGDTTSSATISLNAYLPIPVRYSALYTAFNGADKIAYDSSGVNPTYYKDPYQLFMYDLNQTYEVTSGIEWENKYGDETALGESYKFYPHVSSEGKLTVPSMYIHDIDPKICVNAYVNGQLVWTQPIYIYQNVYDSALLNSWDGELTFDENNGTILSAMVGAGKKNNDNTFSGVLMGQLAKVRTDSEIGLYGYDHGAQSFGLNIDGTAFFGAPGHGRILVNGTSGTIQSQNYSSTGNGMFINLDTGKLISAYGKAAIQFDPTSDSKLFTITSADGNYLMKIGTEDYLLQSNNYSYDAKTGTKLDLANGNLKGYDFTLESQGSSDSSRIRLSTENPYFKINASSGKTLIYIGDGSYYLQSDDFVSGTSGTRLDLQNGALEAYGNFRLQMGASGGQHFIISNLGSYAIDIKGTQGYCYIGYDGSITTPGFAVHTDGSFYGAKGSFYVTAEGKMYCTDGMIGGWTIDADGIYNDYGFGMFSNGTVHSGGTDANDQFTVSKNGSVTIGGWKITSTAIESKTGAVKLESDGDINITSGDGYVQMGVSTTHLKVSGVNVGDAGISFSDESGINDSLLSGDWGTTGSFTVGTGLTVNKGANISGTCKMNDGWSTATFNWGEGAESAVQAAYDANQDGGIASKNWVTQQITYFLLNK